MTDDDQPTQQFPVSPEVPGRVPTPKPPLYKRKGALIGAAGVLVAVMIGGAAWATVESGSGAATTNTAAQTETTPHAHPRAKHRVPVVVGTIAAENGNTWTITERSGKQVNVTVSPQTKWGTAKSPAQQTQFPVGAEVAVQVKKPAVPPTAVRVVAHKPPQHTGTQPGAAQQPAATTPS
ncbi:hypothetical protein G4X40_15060 [Rhodococcus sp. D2-41]|uniref:DUF5666 domain-containing protein n=1 Tax=Speluncibacter jeojiensis TaxID=2710754 RepID=A0A9X4LZE4_9ACTN|nr:hypothetical protein [Rhodococcus sp. D2-41]MDG3011466.1 hypothetical protein [Rhodococcus sp. D2-41]MDG3015178.1 hypothetical protein [Corynebacteriales bacterium D3-21]